MDCITVCAVNYLPFAKILADTFLAHHPKSKFFLLLVDGDSFPMDFDLDPRILVVKPSDLDLDSETFLRMTVYYDVTELSTALKPLGLKYLLDRGSRIAVYLDPDIAVFANLNEVSDLLKKSDIVLTPHTLLEIPRDGLRPSEHDIMASGTFNLGFIGVRNSTRSLEFLNWWNQRLTFDAIAAIDQNLFTDQRWIDFVPSYFSFAIIRHFGFNVAYWNLHERNLVRSGKNITVNGQPLKFLHFSGYRPDRPWIASKYVEDKPRVVMSQNPNFKELAIEYGNAAIKFGWTSEKQFEYGYSSIQGINLTSEQRRIYRTKALSATMGECEFPPLPTESSRFYDFFRGQREMNSGRLSSALYRVWKSRTDLQAAFPSATTIQSDDFVTWAHLHGIREGALSEHEIYSNVESGRLSDALYLVWKSRADLQAAFPSATTIQAEDFVRWAHLHGIREGALSEHEVYLVSEDEVLIPEVLAENKFTSKLGVNLAGYHDDIHGVAYYGRLVAKSALSTSLPYTLLTLSNAPSNAEVSCVTQDEEVYYPLTLATVNSDQFSHFLESLPNGLRSHSKFVGVWAWETEDFPDNLLASLELVDEVWAISTFCRDAIQPHTNKLVHVFPAPIVAPECLYRLEYQKIGMPKTRPYNLFVFDYRSVFKRKNPLDLIAAHRSAFPDGLGPSLIIKTINSDEFISQHENLLFSASDRDDIIILDKFLSRDQLLSLINECDVYISLHRSEGYGLTIAEAMSLGKPVIATGYSGNLDFMDETNSILVPYELVYVGQDAHPYSPDSMWAQPDIQFAANAMRQLFLSHNDRETIGKKAKLDTSSTFTLERASNFVIERLTQLLD